MTSHCSPSSDPTAVNVCSVDEGNVFVVEPASGLRRGIIVWLHGGPQAPIAVPTTITDSVFGNALTWATAMAADGWVSVAVNYPEDFVTVPGMGKVHEDVTADLFHGARFVTTTLKWWDHVVSYLQRRYGAWPIVVNGGSWGGWHTLQIMNHSPGGIAGFICSRAAVKFTGIIDGVAGKTWTTLNSTGADNASSCLNAVTVPGIIEVMLGDGTSDSVVNVPDQIAVKTAAVAAGRSITYIPKTSGSHFDPSAYTSAAGAFAADPLNWTYWMTNTMDPLCPKVY